MFIRSKIARGKTYYQIVEGVRDGARVRQRVVVALGPGVHTLRSVRLSDEEIEARKDEVIGDPLPCGTVVRGPTGRPVYSVEPPTPAYALKRMKSELANLRRRRNYKAWPKGHVSPSKTLNRRLERLDRQIGALAERVEILTEIVKQGLVVPTNERLDHAV